MPNTREKLIELLGQVQDCGCNVTDVVAMNYVENFELADHLIANGVTVQEEAKLYWKPVEPGKWNLTCSACDSHLGCREGANFCPECGAKFVYPKAVAHQPTKGE